MLLRFAISITVPERLPSANKILASAISKNTVGLAPSHSIGPVKFARHYGCHGPTAAKVGSDAGKPTGPGGAQRDGEGSLRPVAGLPKAAGPAVPRLF